MRIRIIRQPSGAVDGVSLRDYDMGRRYDLPSSLAQYLVTQGFAFLEMRQSRRSTRWRLTDRRIVKEVVPCGEAFVSLSFEAT